MERARYDGHLRDLLTAFEGLEFDASGVPLHQVPPEVGLFPGGVPAPGVSDTRVLRDQVDRLTSLVGEMATGRRNWEALPNEREPVRWQQPPVADTSETLTPVAAPNTPANTVLADIGTPIPKPPPSPPLAGAAVPKEPTPKQPETGAVAEPEKEV